MDEGDSAKSQKISTRVKSPREIGKLLRETRQEKGFTLENIWKATRIQSKIIEALEEGRADDLLSRVYIMLFLKKYTALLGLNDKSLVSDYKAFYDAPGDQILDVAGEPQNINIDFQKWAAIAPYAALILAALVLVSFLGVKVNSFFHARKIAAPRVVKAVSDKPIPEKHIITRMQKLFPIPRAKSIDLVLSSTEDVWMKVKSDGKRVFEGTLVKNGKKKWSADQNINLWIGRAEALNFTINGASIGNIGKGNIKNIEISKSGLTIGRKQLFGAKK